jgi:hypothetical protein
VPITLNNAAIKTSGAGVIFVVSAKAKAYSTIVIPASASPDRISKLALNVSTK